MLKRSFRSNEVIRLTGLTQRQLDYWAKTGFIVPSDVLVQGKRTRRQYSFTDLVAFRTALKLLSVGIPLQRVRRAVAELQKRLGSYASQQLLSQVVFVTDGQDIFELLTDPPLIVNILTGQSAFLFAVNIAQLTNVLERDIAIISLPEPSKSKRKTYEIPRISAYGM